MRELLRDAAKAAVVTLATEAVKAIVEVIKEGAKARRIKREMEKGNG